MRNGRKTLLIVLAMVLGAYVAVTPASEPPPPTSDTQEECVVDERAECTERCITEHNCCVKSCNWVKSKDKSKCLKQCKSVLKKCEQACDEQQVATTAN